MVSQLETRKYYKYKKDAFQRLAYITYNYLQKQNVWSNVSPQDLEFIYKGRNKESPSLNVVDNKTDNYVCRYNLSPLGVPILKLYETGSLKVVREVTLPKKIEDDISSAIKDLIKGHGKDLEFVSSVSLWASQKYIFFGCVDVYGSESTVRWS